MMTTTHIPKLGDAELLCVTTSLVKQSNTVTAELLLHLGEVDARKLYLERAYPSMFAFCVGDLGLSEDATCNLVTVARASRQHPVILEALRAGRVHLTGLRILAPHLTEENTQAVLTEATGRSKRDIEALAARLAPKPPVPDSIRKLPEPTPAASSTTGAGSLFAASPPASQAARTTVDLETLSPAAIAPLPSTDAAPPVRPTPIPRAHHATLTPLSGETYKVQFSASRALRDKLLEAQGLLRHANPNGELSAVIERALDCLIADVKKKRFGIGSRVKRAAAAATLGSSDSDHAANAPLPSRSAASPDAPPSQRTDSRHVPIDLRRAVFVRDEGRCTFVDAAGRRCEERGGLELDHADGFARTHTHSVDGLRLRCRPHNQHAADLLYGREFMDRARQQRVSAPGRIEAGRTRYPPRGGLSSGASTIRPGAD